MVNVFFGAFIAIGHSWEVYVSVGVMSSCLRIIPLHAVVTQTRERRLSKITINECTIYFFAYSMVCCYFVLFSFFIHSYKS